MNVRQWLSRYLELMEEVERETKQAHYWEDTARGLSSMKLELTPKTRRFHDLSDYVAKFLDLAHDCSELGDQAEQAKGEILQVIEDLEDPLIRRILKMRYIDDMTYLDIASKLHYSIGYVRRLMSQAIKEVTKSNTYQLYNIN